MADSLLNPTEKQAVPGQQIPDKAPDDPGQQNAAAVTGAEPPAGQQASWMADKDGVLSQNWREHLPEGIRGAKCLDNIRSLSAMANSYVNAQRMIGANKIAVPGQNSSQEEWDAAYNALGRPKDASAYTVPADMRWASAEQRDGVLKQFHAAGLSDRQAGAMMKLYGDLAAEAERSADASRAKSEAELRSLWGFSYDENIRLANSALSRLGLAEVLQGNPALNDSGFIRAMAEAGRSLGETSIGSPRDAGGSGSALEELMRDPAYMDASNPRHQSVVNQIMAIMATRGGR